MGVVDRAFDGGGERVSFYLDIVTQWPCASIGGLHLNVEKYFMGERNKTVKKRGTKKPANKQK